MFPSWLTTLMMAVDAALFSGVCESVLDAQLNTRALLANQPPMYRNAAVYLAALLSVDTLIMKPMQATPRGTEMWKPRSLRLSEE